MESSLTRKMLLATAIAIVALLVLIVLPLITRPIPGSSYGLRGTLMLQIVDFDVDVSGRLTAVSIRNNGASPAKLGDPSEWIVQVQRADGTSVTSLVSSISELGVVDGVIDKDEVVVLTLSTPIDLRLDYGVARVTVVGPGGAPAISHVGG